jgi:hypothetical protein
MTDEEIDKLIAQAHRHLFGPPRQLFAIVILGCLSCALIPGWSFGAAYVATLAAVFWIAFESFTRIEGRKPETTRNAALWAEITNDTGTFRVQSAPVAQIRDRILKIYQHEENQVVFPLKQAVRLFDTFFQQQQRLYNVERKLGQLSVLREKMAQLSELGDENSGALAKLQQIKPHETALRTLAQETRSSCSRLEAIIENVEKFAKVRQLQSEITQLASTIQPHLSAPNVLVAEELNDIERQIAREVETFLQLERETDRHMREI